MENKGGMAILSEHFNDALWPLIIKPTIESADKDIDPEFKDFVEVDSFVNMDDYKTKLSTLYERKRDWLKRIYFRYAQPNDETLLDMHKIAAIICRCIIGCKPFAFDVDAANKYKDNKNKNENLDWIINNYFVNYKVAVNCAISITLFDLFDRLGEISKSQHIIDVKNILNSINEKGFDLYQREPMLLKTNHESFYKSIIIQTAINDINKRNFDYLGMATTCFQIQQYEVLRSEYLKLYNVK